jgi:hypothetical protein
VRPGAHYSAVVDLSSYRGYFLEPVTVASAAGGTAAVAMDSPGGWHDLIDEVSVRRLRCTGPWPSEAHHLLQHHNNDADLLWMSLTGPTHIETVARTLTVQ